MVVVVVVVVEVGVEVGAILMAGRVRSSCLGVCLFCPAVGGRRLRLQDLRGPAVHTRTRGGGGGGNLADSVASRRHCPLSAATKYARRHDMHTKPNQFARPCVHTQRCVELFYCTAAGLWEERARAPTSPAPRTAALADIVRHLPTVGARPNTDRRPRVHGYQQC